MSKTVTPKKQHELMFEMEKEFFWFTSLRDNEKYFIDKNFKDYDKQNIYILDAGCGTGYFVYELKESGYKAQGFDYSDNAIELSQKRGLKLNEDIFQMNIFDLKFEKESFDCIILNDVLFAFDTSEASTIVKNLASLLKPGGIFLGQTAAFQFLYSQTDIVAGTKHRYVKKEIQLLLDNDFIIKKISYRNFILFLPFLIKRIFEKKEIDREQAKSSLNNYNPYVNIVLKSIFYLDNFFLRYMNYFVGGTIFWVAKKHSITYSKITKETQC